MADHDHSLHASHPRSFAANRYVYPVLSRRAGGISIGVNINVDKLCNFNCAYCQVDRRQPVDARPVDLAELSGELDDMISLVVSGNLYSQPRFCAVPARLRRLNDIALSGDGEPTASPQFERVVDICAEARRRHNLDSVKLVLITNASLLDRPAVRRVLDALDANGGEIWAKLDAGTESHYRTVNRSSVPWRRILDNLRDAACERPIVIQSLWMRIRGESPAAAEVDAFCERIAEILSAGSQIKLVQVHTIARRPTETWVAPLPLADLEKIAATLHARTGLPVTAFA